VTKGSISFKGERIGRPVAQRTGAPRLLQVMEGRHCFGHLDDRGKSDDRRFTRRDGAKAIARRYGGDLQLLSAPEGPPPVAGRLHVGRRAADVRDRPRE